MTALVLSCCLLTNAAPAPAPMNPDSQGPDGVYARCGWQPAAALRRGEKQYVFRDGKQLAGAMKLSGPTAGETATQQLARRLNVPTIDWQKQMAVCVAAGLKGAEADRLSITRAVREGRTLTIYYTLSVDRPAKEPGDKPMTPPGGAGFGCPAQTALVSRFDGTIRFQQEDPPRAAPGKD